MCVLLCVLCIFWLKCRWETRPNPDIIIEPTIKLRLDIFSHTTDFSIRPLSSVHLLSLQSLAMALCDGLSHCKLALAFAVLMDVVGGTALLMGVFAPLEIKGQDFGDLLVYTGMKSLMHCGMSVVGDRFGPVLGFCGWPDPSSSGALLVLASLAGWVLWYSGNIEGLTSRKELGHIGSAVDRLARNLSRKMRTYRGQYWSNGRTSWFFTFVSINRSYFPAFQKRQTSFWQVLFLYIRSCWISMSFFSRIKTNS